MAKGLNFTSHLRKMTKQFNGAKINRH